MEYDGLTPRGMRITIDIDPTGLFEAEPYLVSDVGSLPAQIVDLVAKAIPSGWLATAKVRAKV